MPRDKIFISYSHQDRDYFEEFRTHLGKNWGHIDIWTDQELEASDKWREEINRALDSAAVAVFLVSPDFLNSKFVREKEAPILLGAREEGILGIGILYIIPSGVDRGDCTFEAHLPGGEVRQVRLTDYQGLNSYTNTIQETGKNARDRLYQDAINKLIGLYDSYKQPSIQSRSLRTTEHRLTIRLTLNDKYLTHRYLGPYSSFLEHRTRWSDLNKLLNGKTRGNALFRILFGLEDEDQSSLVLQHLLERSGDTLPNPTFKPIRLCIETDNHEIADLPWGECSWKDRALTELNWTVEFNRLSNANRQPSHADIHIETPCPVLTILPMPNDNDDSNENHRHALQETFNSAWPIYKDHLLCAENFAQIKEKFDLRQPEIVYFCGRCRTQGDRLLLTLCSNSDKEPIDLDDMAKFWREQPPRVLILNLLDEDLPEVGTRIQHLLESIPLILVLKSCNTEVQHTRLSALKWLNHILQGNGDTDPVAAMHVSANNYASAWTAYKSFRIETLKSSPRDKLARLLLDRWEQRTMVKGLVDEMQKQGRRRVTSFVAYGEKGNIVEEAPDQFIEYIQRHAGESIAIHRVNLALPEDDADFDARSLRKTIQRQVFSEDIYSEASWIESKRPKAKSNRSPFLFLDFGCRGSEGDPGLTASALRAWADYCANILATACPGDMAVLCCLSLERPKNSYKNIKNLLTELAKDAHYNNRLARFAQLSPFSDIDETHLKDFLDGPNNSSCPEKIMPEMTHLICAAANVNFKKNGRVYRNRRENGMVHCL